MEPPSEPAITQYEDAIAIQVAERDFELEPNKADWPDKSALPEGWIPAEGVLHRNVAEVDGEKNPEKELAGQLKESILRFPSAPIHGLHRLHEYHVNQGEAENFHTYRLLEHPDRDKPVERVFLLHNGLNETQSVGLYYRLASHLIHKGKEKTTACLLRPFPGHLTRSRFYRYAETPLDHYLWDGSHLFRQFLRYMIETQWLLSVLARRSSYRCISGLNLLQEEREPDGSRLDDAPLAAAIQEAWRALNEKGEKRESAPRGEPPEDAAFIQAVASLRSALQLETRLGGDFDPEVQEKPSIHVIGYSLGGFMAQSVFMSWPFLVASCSTLLSGGALRELAPTAFADPEEWQTVLHSLRYELDEAMMSGGYGRDEEDRVAGIEHDLFLFLKSTFYEVFQQEYRGSFQTRLAAFRRRMLFVVGGNDPIVRPQSVLDSGPPDGINMFAIGGLGHFLESKTNDQEEEEQRNFWIPEIGRLIGSLADDAAPRQHNEREETWLDEKMHFQRKSTSPVSRLSIAERLAVQGQGALSSALFQRHLDDLLVRASKGEGLLFILRNEAPTVLLDKDAVQEHAAALHHNDAAIAEYVKGVAGRRDLMLEQTTREHMCLLLPWNAKAIMEQIDEYPGHPSQAEGAGGQMPSQTNVEDTWTTFHETLDELADESTPEAVRICDGELGVDWGGLPEVDTMDLARVAREKLNTSNGRAVTPSLPDCWVWLSWDFLRHEESESLSISAGRKELCRRVPGEYQDKKKIANKLRDDSLRIVTVSRSRYNPRYRGRIVVQPGAAAGLLFHATLCIASSIPLADYDLAETRVRGLKKGAYAKA